MITKLGKTIRGNIKAIMKERGVSFTALCRQAAEKQRDLARFDSKTLAQALYNGNFKLDTLERLACVCQVSPVELITPQVDDDEDSNEPAFFR